MGQKSEKSAPVQFAAGDKDCLARLLKELQKANVQGSKVRSSAWLIQQKNKPSNNDTPFSSCEPPTHPP